jgi:hypothetical protein
MKLNRLNSLLAASGLISVTLAGCVGGGGDAPASSAASVSVPVTVVDGAIKNAVVCLDKNSNGACDSGEPSGITDVDGKVTLVVSADDAGKYPVLALVGTDAIDKDNGPVTVPFALKAPADATAVVSPLTTLVQAHIEISNTTTAAAVAAVKEQLGVTSDPMADFTKGVDAASQQAGTLARLVVITKQEQVTATAGATASGGAALSAADIDAAVNARLLQLLPSLLAAATDPSVTAASTPAAKEAALLAAAQSVAAEAGLTKDNVGTVVAATKQTPTGESAAVDNAAGASLRWFSFTNINNYFIRAFVTSAEQAVVDANGKRHFSEYRASATNGVVLESGVDPAIANNYPRNQIYWTGSEWFDCPLTFVSDTTPWNAQGESESLFCKSFQSKTKRSARDIAGVKMIDLVKEIRAYPLADSAGNKFPAWGPNPSDAGVIAALADKAFPASSKLYYVTSTPLVNPDVYGTLASSVAKVFPAAIANGESAGCTTLRTTADSTTLQSDAATLDEMIARAPGTPCPNTVNTAVHGSANESWGPSTVGIGEVTVAPFSVPSNFYKNDVKRIRAAFGANNAVTYYSCLARATDNNPRNCTSIGTGTYSIEAQGDARVLRLGGAPAAAAGLPYSRIFVERGGKVYSGARDKPAVSNQLRLNGPAADSLLLALGIN